MSVWVEVFIIVAAVAIVVQTFILVTVLLSMRKTVEQLAKVAAGFESRIDPILSRTDRILADSETRVASIVGDAAEITRLAREQIQKVDLVFTDATDRMRAQVIRADQIITGTLETIEDTGGRIKRTVWEPVNQVSAVLKGIKVGLDFLRNQRHGRSEAVREDEELFI